MAANNIYIQVDLNSASAQANVNALNAAIAKTGPEAKKSADEATKGLGNVNISVSQTTKAFEEMTAALAGLGLARLAQNVISVGSELNRAQKAMEAFVGSAQEAAVLTEQIRAVAAQSPFAFKDLEQGARRLAGFGVQAKEIATWIKIVSDQVAAMGGSIEDVTSIVTLFGRVMEKDTIGAMDIMRKLPSEGANVKKALTEALGRQTGVAATFDDVKKAIKEGALDPMVTLHTLLGSMQSQTAGAGARMNDFAMTMKNVGDALDRAKELLVSDQGFGPALRTLGREIEAMLAPVAALIKFLMGLPEPVKVLIVNLVAATAAVVAFGTAWKVFSTLADPAIIVIKGLATALTESLLPALLNPEILIAIAAIGAAIVALTQIFPDQTKKFLDGLSEMWGKMKAKVQSLAQESGLLPKGMLPPKLPAATGNIAVETEANLKEVQQKVNEWADAAGHTMLNALSSPAEAVIIKYKDLFDKLNEQIKSKFITPEHAEALRAQLGTAQQMEMDAKLLEKRKKNTEEFYKSETEQAKAAYEAQVLYIEAQDAQNLRTRIANIDKITQLRQESAQVTARLEKEQLDDQYNAQVEYFEKYKDLFTKAGVDVAIAEANLRQEVDAKAKAIDRKAADDAQKYRLEGWKRANDLIIEDQKRVYEAFQSMFDQVFDAFTDKTKSMGQALGDMFKRLALGEVRNLFSSQMASIATQAAGYGEPEQRIRRSGGILGVLLQRGMPPRPMMEPPQGYTPTKAEAEVKFGEITDAVQGGAARIADAAGAYNVSAVIFANAVNRFSQATIEHQAAATDMAEAAGSISGGGGEYEEAFGKRYAFGSQFRQYITTPATEAIQQASAATGVPVNVLTAVAQAESAMRPGAVSPKGAQGLFQLMPATQKDWGVTSPFDPYQSAMGGASQLQRLLTRYGTLPAALAAYNYGPGNYDRAVARGRALPAETSNYVARVLGLLDQDTAEAPATFARATHALALPAGFSVDASGRPVYSAAATPSELAWSLPAPPAAALTPDTSTLVRSGVAQARQAGLMHQLAGVLMGGLGKPESKDQQTLRQRFGNLRELFGIGGGPEGHTTAGSVLMSKGAQSLETMAGLAIASKGLQQRSSAVTLGGAALTGFGMASTMGMTGMGGAITGVGGGLVALGLQRGGARGLAMDVAGGAIIGMQFGGPLGAAIGAAAGAVIGFVRLFVKTETERIRTTIKQVYGIDIANYQILAQVKQIVDQNYGGNVSVGVRSKEVQDLVRLYALSTGQAANMPRQMYAATVAQSTQGLQLQPVYQGGTQMANPYSGPTQYQYQTAVAGAQGLTGVPGREGLINDQWQQLTLRTIQGNPSAIAMASAAAATAGDSRLTHTAAMQEPLTALS